jgi:hypothetical protein
LHVRFCMAFSSNGAFLTYACLFNVNTIICNRFKADLDFRFQRLILH